MKSTVTFGEIMLRLSPENRKRIIQADRFDANYGGSEANVAAALSNMGVPTEFVTALPENDIGKAAENFVRSFGVSTRNSVKKIGRMGIYYLEKGAAQRPSKVVYDREGSVFSKACPEDYIMEQVENSLSEVVYSIRGGVKRVPTIWSVISWISGNPQSVSAPGWKNWGCIPA